MICGLLSGFLKLLVLVTVSDSSLYVIGENNKKMNYKLLEFIRVINNRRICFEYSISRTKISVTRDKRPRKSNETELITRLTL